MPWQCTVWRKYLSQRLKLTEQQIRRTIFNLQTTNEIAVKTTNKYSLITICKWEEYQDVWKKQPTKQPTTHTENNQQTTTTKEDIPKGISIRKKEEIKEEEFFPFYKVNDLFKQFLEMRKSIKAYPSENAIWLLVKKLQRFNDETKIVMLENSIVNQWKDVYPPKPDKPVYGKYTPPPWAIEWMRYKNQPSSWIVKQFLSGQEI